MIIELPSDNYPTVSLHFPSKGCIPIYGIRGAHIIQAPLAYILATRFHQEVELRIRMPRPHPYKKTKKTYITLNSSSY
jgi:hypothetical protein